MNGQQFYTRITQIVSSEFKCACESSRAPESDRAYKELPRQWQQCDYHIQQRFPCPEHDQEHRIMISIFYLRFCSEWLSFKESPSQNHLRESWTPPPTQAMAVVDEHRIQQTKPRKPAQDKETLLRYFEANDRATKRRPATSSRDHQTRPPSAMAPQNPTFHRDRVTFQCWSAGPDQH